MKQQILYTNRIEDYGNTTISLKDIIHTQDDCWDAYMPIIIQAFDCLTDKQKQTIKLYFDGLTITEISNRLKRKPPNVLESIKTATKRLKKRILVLALEKFK